MPRFRLDKLMVERGLAASREKAQALILAGQIQVNGQAASKAGAAVRLRPLGELPFGVAWRRLDVQPRDPDAFCGWIDRRLSEIRQARARQGETVA